jgi:hypothetical protein
MARSARWYASWSGGISLVAKPGDVVFEQTLVEIVHHGDPAGRFAILLWQDAFAYRLDEPELISREEAKRRHILDSLDHRSPRRLVPKCPLVQRRITGVVTRLVHSWKLVSGLRMHGPVSEQRPRNLHAPTSSPRPPEHGGQQTHETGSRKKQRREDRRSVHHVVQGVPETTGFPEDTASVIVGPDPAVQ